MAGAISFAGIASGIDSDAIIKSVGDTRRLALQPFKDKQDTNKKESDALEELNTKLLALRDAVKDFRTLAGSPIIKNAISSNEDAVTVSASNNAIVSSTTVNVQKLAKSATFSFADRFSDPNAALAPGLSGTANINLTVGQGSSAAVYTVPVTNTTTLSEVIAQVNELSGGKVVSSAVNVGTESAPQYVMLMQTTDSGVDKGSLAVSADSALTAQGLFTDSTLSQAADAVFDVSGIGTITRASNKVTGLIPGVVLDLRQEGTGPVLVQVNDDRDKTAEKFDTLVGAINTLVKYVQDNNKIERKDQDGTVGNVYGDLAHGRTDDQLIQQLRDMIRGTNAGAAGTEVNVMADLGLTIERDGTYKFDATAFVAQVAADPAGATALLSQFADDLGTTNGTIDEFTKFGGQIDIAKQANDDENKTMQDRIDAVEASIDKQAQALKMLYANLEQRIGQLNSNADALGSILSGGVQRKK